MKENRTKEQLIEEVVELRRRVAELESSETKRRQALVLAEAEASKVATESIEEMFEAVMIMDLDGTIRQVNSEFERGAGWKKEEAVGRTPIELGVMSKEEYQKFEKELLPRLIKEGSIRNIETTAIRKDGAKFPALLSWTLMKDADGKPTGIISRAIIESRKVLEALHKSEEHLAIAIESSGAGFYEYFTNLDLVDVGERNAELLGYTLEELPPASQLGSWWRARLHPDDRSRVLKTYGDFLEGRVHHFTVEFRILDKSGDWRWIQVASKAAERDESGRATVVVGVALDITERKRAEENIKRLNFVLRTMRNICQLITRETDRDRLLEGVCVCLIEDRGYYDAWIALLDESGKLVTAAEAGLGKDFLPIVRMLKRGELICCGREVLMQSKFLVVKDPSSTCSDCSLADKCSSPICSECPLADKHSDRARMAVQLEYEGKVYGLLVASLPIDFVIDEEEQLLFKEIAKDIAFALHNIELEEEHKRAEEALKKADERLEMISQQEAQHWGIAGFVGKSKTIRTTLDNVRRLQDAETTSVLIVGESGTGKELISRAIHFGGRQAKGPFIAVNCTAIPFDLAESLFFGHTRGAFTGANLDQKGYFQLADGGTLFLDEIGEMPLELQPKLLRVLEDGVFTSIGGVEAKSVSVRIVAATNQDLQRKIAQGLFREDLYFRLARFTVAVPPLRERPEDILLLIDHFLNIFAMEMGKEKATLSPDAISALTAYHFPGNVRELKNIIEHAIIESDGSTILPEHLHFINTNRLTPPTKHSRDIKQAASLLMRRARVRTGRTGGNSETNTLSSNVSSLPITDEEKILDYVREHGRIGNAECRELLLVDIQRASYLLKKIHRYGLLERVGEGRWAYYRLA